MACADWFGVPVGACIAVSLAAVPGPDAGCLTGLAEKRLTNNADIAGCNNPENSILRQEPDKISEGHYDPVDGRTP